MDPAGTPSWTEYVVLDAELRAAEAHLRAADHPPHVLAALEAAGYELGAALRFVHRQRPVELVEAAPDTVGELAIGGGVEQRSFSDLLDAADPELRGAVLERLVTAVTADPAADNYLEVAGLLWMLTRPDDATLRERVLTYGRGHQDPDIVEMTEQPLEVRSRPPVEPVPRPVPTPTVDAAEAWSRYVAAWTPYIDAFHALRIDPPVDEIAADLRRGTPVATDFVAGIRTTSDRALLERILRAAGAEPPG